MEAYPTQRKPHLFCIDTYSYSLYYSVMIVLFINYDTSNILELKKLSFKNLSP